MRMSSFVTEVLSSAGQLATQEIQGKLEVLRKKRDNLKLQLYEEIQDKYVEFRPKLQTSEDLAQSVDEIAREMNEVTVKIENEIKSQLNTSTEVIQNLNGQLQDQQEVLVVLEKLVQLQECLTGITSANKEQDYDRAASAILKMESLLATPLSGYEDVKILQALQTESRVQKEKFLCDLAQMWKDMVVWKIPEDSGSEHQVCELTIADGTSDMKTLVKVVMAMNKLDILNSTLKDFGDKVVTHLLKPCIQDGETVVNNDQPNKLVVSCKAKKEVFPPVPKQAFPKLLCIFNMFRNSVKGTGNRKSLLELLGIQTSERVLEMVVQDCLTHAIPRNNKDLDVFQEVVSSIANFNTQLVEMKFICDENSALMNFVQNINILFANKKSQGILERARELMTSEIHCTVQISDDKPLGELPPLAKDGPSGKKSRKMELASECQLNNNTFRLPRCHISVSIQELINLAYDTLQEATESSTQCAIQMFYAVRKMFELFFSVFPTCHRKSLAAFPQLSAVFHNNCMFIAHHLMTLGHQFEKKLPKSINASFVDLVPRIRKVGGEIFLQQLSTQKGLMIEYLQGAKGFASVSETDVYIDAERAIKQVIHQLQHLQKVWQEVLPSNIYRKALGTLINSVVIDIVGSIVILEDISSDDAQQLASLLLMIQNKADLLMKNSSDEEINAAVELQRNVPKWLRFKELITILNASLLEISDRWADGKGPLANEFSANEMKQLIRALFQNTDRRSAVLAKIK